MANNNNTADMNGMYSALYDKNPNIAKHALELVSKICDMSNADIEEIWAKFDSKDYTERNDEVEEILGKKKRRTRNKVVKFKPDPAILPNIPDNLRNFFRTKFKQECIDEDRKYTKDYFESAYGALTDNALEELQAEYDEVCKQYDIDYERLKLRAIYNGEYTEIKVKNPINNTRNILLRYSFELNKKYMTKKLISDAKKCKKDMKERQRIVTEMNNNLTEEQIADLEEIIRLDKLRARCQKYERDVILLECKIRYYTHKEPDELIVKRLTKSLQLKKDSPPEDYEDYTSQDNYAPLVDFSEIEG